MPNNHSNVIELINKSEIFDCCSYIDKARLSVYLVEEKVEAGNVIYREDEKADYLFIVYKGTVTLKSDKRLVDDIHSGFFGEEIVFNNSKYMSTASAKENCILYKISKEHLKYFIKRNDKLKENINSSLLNHFSPKNFEISKYEAKRKSRISNVDFYKRLIGWILAIVIPGTIALFGSDWGLEWKSKIFLTIISSTIMMWIFRLAHEFIPSIFAILSILILNVAPTEVALSGFTSGSFFMAMSIFGLSAVLISSGLTYRMVINLLHRVPLSQFWHAATLLFTGIILTPLLPSANGRISLASPLLVDMIGSLGYKKRGKAATALSITVFSGFTMFSSIFLSSKAIHFVIFGLFPSQIREQFNWGHWFYSASVAAVILLVLFVAFCLFYFKNNEKVLLTREHISTQHKLLGPMSTQEWTAFGGILLFLVGIATSSIHKIQLPWIGLTVLYVILAMEFLSKKEFKTSIDWTFLIYLGTLIGLVKSMSYIGLDESIGTHLLWVGKYIKTNFYLFVIMLSFLVIVMRLFIPNNAAVAILVSVFLPVAGYSGVNPWIIAFIILMISDSWLLPYQCTYYLLFEELTGRGKKRLYDKKSFVVFNIVSIAFRLIAIFASVPFWRLIGIL